MKPLSFVIVGSGWRAMFFVRIAKRYPELFDLKYILCRTQEKAEQIQREQGIPTTTSVSDCEKACADFVVVSVSRDAAFPLVKEWLEKGYAVLAETPAAVTEEQMEELWALHQKGARLQIAEQYIRYPLIATGLQAVKQGLLGEPHAVTLSLAHDYHGISVIRHMLNCGLDNPEIRKNGLPTVSLSARNHTYPVMETDSRFGPVTDGSIKQRTRTRVTFEFANGKTAFYDFDGVQYHSFIRARHINVQGPKGEWNDTLLHYVDGDYQPVKEQLRPSLDPSYPKLTTEELIHLSPLWKPEVHMENWQDEYAIATLMLDMRKLIEEGQEGYPLAEALEDAYLWLLMERAAANPDQIISSHPHSWQNT